MDYMESGNSEDFEGRMFIGKVIEKNGKSLPECAGYSPFTSVLP
ncbi:hypothetical protein [Pseudomonas sp. UC 17F4]|nr:hypothetical protein [Pseudomonas sp. UC 17F4]